MQRQRGNPLLRRLIYLIVLAMAGMLAGAVVWLALFIFSEPEVDDANMPHLLANPTSIPMTAAPTVTPSPAFVNALGDESTFPRIFIPSAGVSQVIIDSALERDGWQVDHLGDRVGHLEGTTWLGEMGNIVLAGHVENVDGDPSIFHNIGDLQVGALITLSYQGMAYDYRVVEVKTVESDDLSVVYPVPGEERVTLITCTGYSFFLGEYQQRIVVVAVRG